MKRRTVVLGLAAGVAAPGVLTACGSREASRAPAASQDGSEDADRRLVEAALRDELGALSLADEVRGRFPALRADAERARDTHRAHLRLLEGTDPRGRGRERAVTGIVPGSAAAARRELVRQEARLREQHTAAAMAARSGSLARVLASLAVSSAQLEQVLGAPAGGAG